MLTRIGVCCLCLSLTGSVASPLGDGAKGAAESVAELSGELLRLHESARRSTGRGPLSEEVVEILRALAGPSDGSRPDPASDPLPTAVLLRELRRLAGRVAELEALSGEQPAAPLVRITVARHE